MAVPAVLEKISGAGKLAAVLVLSASTIHRCVSKSDNPALVGCYSITCVPPLL